MNGKGRECCTERCELWGMRGGKGGEQNCTIGGGLNNENELINRVYFLQLYF